MKRPLEFARSQALWGWTPRHVLDVSPKALPVDESILQETREAVEEAAVAGNELAEALEGACHELACIEDSGQSGAFRRLIAIGILAVQLMDRRAQDSGGAIPHLYALHRAVEERWVGATYDLSNCLACLQHLPVTQLEVRWALGTWVWLNLVPAENPAQFRWTTSTRRFEPGLGAGILSRARKLLGDRALEQRRAHQPPANSLTKAEAKAIAEGYLSEQPRFGDGVVVDVVFSWDELPGRRPVVYGKDEVFWSKQWIVYLRRPESGPRSSLIVAVDRTTGEVGYCGSANDEG